MANYGVGGADFSQQTARGNFDSGRSVTANPGVMPLAAMLASGHMFYENSAIVDGTSGGHSALIDILHRPSPDMLWQSYGTVITATHPLTGKLAISALAGQWMTRTLSAFSANGSAPRITTYFEF